MGMYRYCGNDIYGYVYNDNLIYYILENKYYDFTSGKEITSKPKADVKFAIRLDRQLKKGYYLNPKFKLVILPDKAAFVTITHYEDFISEEDYNNSIEYLCYYDEYVAVKYKYNDKVKYYYFNSLVDIPTNIKNSEEFKIKYQDYLTRLQEQEEEYTNKTTANSSLAIKLTTELKKWLDDISVDITSTKTKVSVNNSFRFTNKKPTEVYCYYYNNIPVIELDYLSDDINRELYYLSSVLDFCWSDDSYVYYRGVPVSSLEEIKTIIGEDIFVKINNNYFKLINHGK